MFIYRTKSNPIVRLSSIEFDKVRLPDSSSGHVGGNVNARRKILAARDVSQGTLAPEFRSRNTADETNRADGLIKLPRRSRLTRANSGEGILFCRRSR